MLVFSLWCRRSRQRGCPGISCLRKSLVLADKCHHIVNVKKCQEIVNKPIDLDAALDRL